MRMNYLIRTAWLSCHVLYLGGCTGQVMKPDEASRRPGADSPGGPAGGPDGTGGGGPDGTGGGAGTGETKTPVCVGTVPPLQASRVWRLTHSQFKNTLMGAFGFAGNKVNALPA